jgi:hypothetical protein
MKYFEDVLHRSLELEVLQEFSLVLTMQPSEPLFLPQ